MKTLGIIGGIGPESTVDYYRGILAEWRRLRGDGDAPSILINSIDVAKLLGFVGRGELGALTDYLLAELDRLARGGADFAILASNTPHVVFDAVSRAASLPLVSLVEAAADAVKNAGVRKVALFGTRFTMAGSFYPERFAAHGLEIVRPGESDQQFIHSAYINELLRNDFRPETRERMLAIARQMRDGHGIEGVVLGGTELPLLLRDETHDGLTLFNTTMIHVRRAVAELLAP